MPPVHRPPALRIVAGSSLGASILLAILPFASPGTPLAPVIVVNWLLFMWVFFLECRPIGGRSLPSRPKQPDFVIFRVVLLAFMLAGAVAILSDARNV